jgi:hypothetical protein
VVAGEVRRLCWRTAAVGGKIEPGQACPMRQK